MWAPSDRPQPRGVPNRDRIRQRDFPMAMPRGVKLVPIVDLDISVPIHLIWRNYKSMLHRFVTHVEAEIKD